MPNPDESFRQAVRNNVLLSRVVTAQAVAVVVLLIGIAFMLPLKTTEWLVYEFSSSGNTFVRVAKAGQQLQANEVLLSMQLREYVMEREEINHVDEKERYPSVMAKSASKVAAAFESTYGGENSPLNIDGFKRAVVINRDSKIGTGKGLHQVEFTTTDTINGGKEEKRIWVASIAYTYKAQKVRADEITFNPTGIVITEYSLAQRNK